MECGRCLKGFNGQCVLANMNGPGWTIEEIKDEAKVSGKIGNHLSSRLKHEPLRHTLNPGDIILTSATTN